MPSLPKSSDLPYHLPANLKDQLRELAKLLSIPPHLVEGSGEHELEAMCATILYRHMDARQRYAAMRSIRTLPSRELEGLLVGKALSTTFINPHWGRWSLTNEELVNDIAFHEAIDAFGSIVGVTFSIKSGKDLIKEIYERRKLTRDGIAMLVLWVAFSANKTTLNASREELNRRTEVRRSTYQ